ncbi:MAG: hypothetical protein HYZ50_24910 [Deltaproteobacteria bacterium]|nr:hypothetical protein [Deltaproteobacteria bacterium]
MNPAFHGLQEAANNDPEFCIAARFWNTALRLEMGAEALLLRIEKGQIAEVLSGHQAFAFLTPVNIVVSASADEWQKFLERIPKPFYADLWGAATHHGFKVGGDMESLYAYYPAVRRLFDIMRALAN